MALDPNIALSVKPLQLPDFNAIAQQRQAMEQNAFVMQQARQKQADEQALNAAYQGAVDPQTGQIDQARLTSALAAGGQGSVIPSVQKGLFETQQAGTEAQMSQIKLAQQATAELHTELGNSNSPDEAIANAKAFLQKYPFAQQGIVQGLLKMPQDPQGFAAWKQQQLAETLTAAQQLQQHFEQVSDESGQRTLAMPEYGSGGAIVVPGSEYGPKPVSMQIVQTPEGYAGVNPRTGAAMPITQGGGVTPGEYGHAIEMAVNGIVPGVGISSRDRSPEHNAEVGGVPNSYHLTDNARDFIPPPQSKITMRDLYEKVKAQLGPKGFDVINEGTHVHVEPGPSMAGHARQLQPAPKAEPKAEAAAPPLLTPDGVDAAASEYLATGKMPALGLGSKGGLALARAAIINRAAVLAKQKGVDPREIPGFQADFAANKTALSQLQAQRSKILAFEHTARLNGDQALQLAHKGLAQTGMPIFNAWVQAGRRSVSGNPDVSALDLQIQTFANEYARVTTTATGGGVSSDSARHEIMSKINAAQTPQQFEKVMRQAYIDMDNRKAGYAAQVNELHQNLGGSKKPDLVYNPKTGKLEKP